MLLDESVEESFMKSTAILDVTIYRDDDDQSKNPRLKHAVDFGDVILDRQKESHELAVDFNVEHQTDVRVGAQVTAALDGLSAFARVVLFRGERSLGMMAAWIPLKHTSSFAVECLDTGETIYCCVTFEPR
jgi:hypothetical protein